jgi:hypothetical protein
MAFRKIESLYPSAGFMIIMNTPQTFPPSTLPVADVLPHTWPNNSCPTWSIATGNFASSAPTPKGTCADAETQTTTNSSNIDVLIRENQLVNAILYGHGATRSAIFWQQNADTELYELREQLRLLRQRILSMEAEMYELKQWF